MGAARHHGRVASPGVASGALRLDRPAEASAGDPAHGIVAALMIAATQLRALEARTHGAGAEILRFQIELLEDDPLALELLEAAEADGSPEAAIERVFAGQIAVFEASSNERFAARAADLVDLRDRLLRTLAPAGEPSEASSEAAWTDETILLADGMTPSRFLSLDRRWVVGIVDRRGSTASHVALLARAAGLPMLVDASDVESLAEGRPVLLDAARGELLLEPSADDLRERAPQSPGPSQADAVAEGEGAALLPDGEAVSIQLTVNALDTLSAARPEWFDGIGLVRSELLVRDAQTLADADRQSALYRPLFDWAGERPVTIRLFDAGGDKPLPGLTGADAGGLRGARLLLREEAVLHTQLSAILAAAEGRPVRIMVPMITFPEELRSFRDALDRAAADGCRDAGLVELGMMVEVPAAALRIADFDADFYALGTNDLTQYTLATARDEDLAGWTGALPEAVLDLVDGVVAHGLRVHRPVTICGDVAASSEGLGRLLAIGLRSFCVPPRLAPRFKQFIRSGT